MKKLLLAIAMVAVGFTANAQEKSTFSNSAKEGNWWIAATGLKYSSVEDVSSTFGIQAAVGTFISDDVTLGLGIGVENTSYDAKGVDSETTFKVVPLARKYWSINDRFFIFGQADIPLAFSDAGTNWGVNLRPGVDYFVAENFSIEATFGQIGYNGFSPKEGDGTGDFGIDIDSSSLLFGLKYFF